MPRSVKDSRIIVERTLDHTKFPDGLNDTYTWTMSVPPRGFMRRAVLILSTTTNHADFSNGEDGGGVFVMPNGPADGTDGADPLTIAQSQTIIARSALNGQRAPEYGGGNLRLVNEGGTTIYVTMLTLDFAFVMFNTQSVSRTSAGASHVVGFYYDFTDYQGPSQGNVDMHFTWIASSRDWTDEIHSGRFRLEIEPR